MGDIILRDRKTGKFSPELKYFSREYLEMLDELGYYYVPDGDTFYITDADNNDLRGLLKEDVVRLFRLAECCSPTGVFVTENATTMDKESMANVLRMPEDQFSQFWDRVYGKLIVTDSKGHLTLGKAFRRGKLSRLWEEITQDFLGWVRRMYDDANCPYSTDELYYIFSLLNYTVECGAVTVVTEDVFIEDYYEPEDIKDISMFRFCTLIGVDTGKAEEMYDAYEAICNDGDHGLCLFRPFWRGCDDAEFMVDTFVLEKIIMDYDYDPEDLECSSDDLDDSDDYTEDFDDSEY